MARVMGKTLNQIYEHFAGLSEVDHLRDAHRDFQNQNKNLICLFPETRTMLEHLKKKHIACIAVTSRGRASAQSLLEHAGIDAFLSAIIGPEEVEHPKPHPEGILQALAIAGARLNETGMVGDTDADINAG